MLFRVQTSEGDELSRAAEGSDIAEFGQEVTGGQVANTGNRSQQLALTAQVGMLVNMVLNEFFGVLDLLVQEGNVDLQLVNDRRRGGFSAEPVFSLLTGLFQVLQMTDQPLQFLPGRVGGLQLGGCCVRQKSAIRVASNLSVLLRRSWLLA